MGASVNAVDPSLEAPAKTSLFFTVPEAPMLHSVAHAPQ